MRFFILTSLLAASGCAPHYRKPCVTPIQVTLEDGRMTDTVCRREMPSLKSDDGSPIGDAFILGCSSAGGFETDHIIVPDDALTIQHELRHVWDKRCPAQRAEK